MARTAGVVLTLLTWAASLFVYRTTRNWFENDVSLRAQLAVSGATTRSIRT